MPQISVPYMQFRGGSSKGLYFLASDLPADEEQRNELLINAMGRGERQIDGLGGADPLTSKIAIVSPSTVAGADIDYLFVQVVVGEDRVDTTPNCGNILAGVGPFALETGLVQAQGDETRLVVNMLNSGKLVELIIQTPNGKVEYQGDAKIDGVPGTSAPIVCNYKDVAGSACGSLLPTGNVKDTVDGVEVTCIDNGMPVVVIRAQDMGISGYETPDELNANEELKAKLQSMRLQLGPMMNLGDVDGAAVPKMCMISTSQKGGLINTRTFIPYKCHSAIGVLGAVSAATACIMPGSVGEELADIPKGNPLVLSVEHPSGEFSVTLDVEQVDGSIKVNNSGLLRTARLLSKGEVFVAQA